jgi:formiminoglutamate deiminase
MYETAAALTPETYERIATAVYMEMAMAGVTAVGEFHYVHHQEHGVPYTDRNEMAHALIRAARAAGVRITLLDAGYFSAGFGNDELSPVQERFRDPSPEDWLDRVAELAAGLADASDVVVGLAPHSVRAVPPEALRGLGSRPGTAAPLHIHVSEQPSENRDCLEATGLTPTGLLAECGLLGPMTTLVHATHVGPDDISLIGSSSSGVCYCATTERDLGDGIGPASALADAGARLSVGSDSHAVVDLFEEARGIELHQRLSEGRRGLHSPGALMTAATTGGAEALGLADGGIRPGAPADFVLVDLDSPRLAGLEMAHGLEGVVFAATSADVSDVFAGGHRIVEDGFHPGWESARGSFNPIS